MYVQDNYLLQCNEQRCTVCFTILHTYSTYVSICRYLHDWVIILAYLVLNLLNQAKLSVTTAIATMTKMMKQPRIDMVQAHCSHDPFSLFS